MKLVFKSIKSGQGSVCLIPQESEDMWHAYNLITQGDQIKSSTFRKIKRPKCPNSDECESFKVHITLVLMVEETYFDNQSSILRIKGKNILENEYVKKGAYHTLELNINKKFTLSKDEWDSIDLDRIENACNIEKKADLAAVIMQEGIAHLCLISPYTTLLRAKIDVNIPKKRKGFCSQHDKSLMKFYDSILSAILQQLNFDIIKCVLIASPGFVKDRFYEFLMEEATKNNNKTIIDNRFKFILAHSSSGFMNSLTEVLSDATLSNKLSDVKATCEVKALENFYSVLQTEPERAYYGRKHVQAALYSKAIETLLVSDSVFRDVSTEERKKLVRLVKQTEQDGGEVYMFSSMHVSGEQLDQLTGIAAILRFPMPELDKEDGEIYGNSKNSK